MPFTGTAIIRSSYDLNLDSMNVLRPLSPLSGVGTVNEQSMHGWVFAHRGCHRVVRRVSILHAGCTDTHCQEQAQGINDQTSLAPFDLFAGVVPTFSALGRATS